LPAAGFQVRPAAASRLQQLVVHLSRHPNSAGRMALHPRATGYAPNSAYIVFELVFLVHVAHFLAIGMSLDPSFSVALESTSVRVHELQVRARQVDGFSSKRVVPSTNRLSIETAPLARRSGSTALQIERDCVIFCYLNCWSPPSTGAVKDHFTLSLTPSRKMTRTKCFQF